MRIKDEKAMLGFGRKLAGALQPGDVITLSGPLSAGKTTMVRGLLAGLGHRGEVPSPSFAIVQPYEELKPPVWHVDLYRIDDPSDLDELGLDDVGQEGVLLVEWPEHAGHGAWPWALALSLEVLDDGARALTAVVPAAWEGRWPLQ
jgi:tRNA threonylcarbamoyladenosine biosynthesis protein TsaE